MYVCTSRPRSRTLLYFEDLFQTMFWAWCVLWCASWHQVHHEACGLTVSAKPTRMLFSAAECSYGLKTLDMFLCMRVLHLFYSRMLHNVQLVQHMCFTISNLHPRQKLEQPVSLLDAQVCTMHCGRLFCKLLRPAVNHNTFMFTEMFAFVFAGLELELWWKLYVRTFAKINE